MRCGVKACDEHRSQGLAGRPADDALPSSAVCTQVRDGGGVVLFDPADSVVVN